MMSINAPDTLPPHLDPVRILTKSIKTILLAGIVGAVAGLLASTIVLPRWSAKMTIQLGQVWIPDARGSFVPAPQPLENQSTATERYNLPSFRLQVLGALGLPAPQSGNKDSDLIFKSLKATTGRSPNVITAEVSAYSRESAEATLDAALKAFVVPHQKLFEQTIKDLQSNLAFAQNKLTSTQKDYVRIGDALKLAVTSGSATTSARDILASNTATLINAQLLSLQQQVGAYQDALTPLRTYPTTALGPAYVPMQSSTPSTTVFIASGAVVGLMLAAGLILFKNSARAA